jgi:predicted transcriptional regulator
MICFKLNTKVTHYMIMAVNINNIEEVLESELRISKQEAKLFLLIVYKGKVNAEMISKMLHWSINDADRVAKSLVNRGMIIDITKTEYESLHPRFAVTNRYRRRCEEDHIIFKKNIQLDNIGMLLEGPYNSARIK